MFETELQQAFSPALEIFWHKYLPDDKQDKVRRLGLLSNNDIQRKIALFKDASYEQIIKLAQPPVYEDSDRWDIWRINALSALLLSHTQLNMDQLKELSSLLGIFIIQLAQLSAALGREDLVKMLVSNNPEMISVNEFAIFRYSAASGQQPLLECIAKNSPHSLQKMIAADKSYAFRQAAQNGHMGVMLYLAEQSPDQQLKEHIVNNKSYSLTFITQNGLLYVQEVGISDTNELHNLEYGAEKLSDLIAIDNLKFGLRAGRPTLQMFSQKYPNRTAQLKNMLENSFNMTRKSLEQYNCPALLSKKKEELISYIDQLKAEGSVSIITLILVLQKTRSLFEGNISETDYQNLSKKIENSGSPEMKILGGLMIALGLIFISLGGVLAFTGIGAAAGAVSCTIGLTAIASGTFFCTKNNKHQELSMTMNTLNEIECPSSNESATP